MRKEDDTLAKTPLEKVSKLNLEKLYGRMPSYELQELELLKQHCVIEGYDR